MLVALVLAHPAAWAAPVDVDVTGIEGELLANVRAGLTLEERRKGRLTEPEIRELHRRAPEEVERALEPYGYYQPLVTADLETERSRWKARYHVDPGPPLAVDSLDVRVEGPGSRDPVFVGLIAGFPIARGQTLVHSEYEEAKDAFTRAGLKHGYLDGRFTRSEIRIDRERYVAALVLHFETGPAYQFGPVEFRQDVVHPEMLSGYVKLRRGDPLDFNRLVEIEQALGNSPFFSRIEVRPRRDLAIGTEIPIVVELWPAKAEKYTFGVGYGTDNGPHGRGAVELRRLNRRGHRGAVEGTLSGIERSAGAKYQVPWPYPRSDVLTLSAGFSRVQSDISLERTAAIGPSWSRLWAGWQQSVALLYRREDYRVGLDHGLAHLLSPDASWSRFRANDPVDPTAGRRLHYRVSVASSQLYSDATFLRLEAQGKWIRTLRKKHRLIGRLEAGSLWTRDFRELPPSVRFFAGGTESVRGFGYNQLGVRDVAGNNIGGRRLVTGSLEYEMRLMPHWGVAAFYDAGNAMQAFQDPLEHGAGVGVRWVSPIGVVRADLAVPLSVEKFRLEFHLAIGPSL